MSEPLLGSAAASGEPAAPTHRLGTCRKLSFAIGGVPNPITSIVTTFYLSPFLLEVARVRPAAVGVIVLVGRVIDAFTDPLVGALSDHTKSRFGRRRPWMFFSIVPFACSFAAVFWTWDIFGVQLSGNGTLCVSVSVLLVVLVGVHMYTVPIHRLLPVTGQSHPTLTHLVSSRVTC